MVYCFECFCVRVLHALVFKILLQVNPCKFLFDILIALLFYYRKHFSRTLYTKQHNKR